MAKIRHQGGQTTGGSVPSSHRVRGEAIYYCNSVIRLS